MKCLGKIAVALAGGLALNAGLCAPNPAAVPNKPQPLSLAHNSPSPSGDASPANSSVDNPSPNNALSDNPYAMIATRNVFGLLPPPPPPDPADQAKKDLPKITPTGIMGVFGHLQVFFKVAPAKPGGKEEYYTLSEGQMQDDIAVTKIDDEKSLVTFENHGFTQELPLAEPADSGAAPAASGGGMNSATPQGASGGGNNGSGGFTRFGEGSGGNNGGTPNGNPDSNGGGPSAVNGGMNFGANTQGHIYQPENSSLTPENAQIILVANHLKAIQENSPTAPLFPPSVIDKEAGIPSNTEPPNP